MSRAELSPDGLAKYADIYQGPMRLVRQASAIAFLLNSPNYSNFGTGMLHAFFEDGLRQFNGTGAVYLYEKMWKDLVFENDKVDYEKVLSLNQKLRKFDEQWVKDEKQKSEKIQREVKKEIINAKDLGDTLTCFVKHMELGKHLESKGDFTEAFRQYLRGKDYCTNHDQQMEAYYCIIHASVLMNNVSQASGHIMKLKTMVNERLRKKNSDAKFLAMKFELNCLLGVSNMIRKRFELAADSFTNEIPNDIENIVKGTTFYETFCLKDIALYSGLCALAGYTRNQLQTKVLKNASFKSLLEHFPIIWEILDEYCSSNFSSCFQKLDSLELDLQFDMFTEFLARDLISSIKERALISYTVPYSSLDLKPVAENVFGISVTDLESRLARLIVDNKIKARIDSHNKILYSMEKDERSEVYQKALDLGNSLINETESMIFRMSLMKNDFDHQPKHSVSLATDDGNPNSNKKKKKKLSPTKRASSDPMNID